MIADHLSVLQALDIPVEDVRVICLDPAYVRGRELDIKAMLVEEDHLFNVRGHPQHSIRELCTPLQRDLRELAGSCER